MDPNLLNDTPNKTYRYTESKLIQKQRIETVSRSDQKFFINTFLWDTLYTFTGHTNIYTNIYVNATPT